ncbi:hypothetical protein PENTCL1PPCAC_15666 [Pristionchus entomophagus]|uniref:G protein-coupled receptor n=1 Tax=Pristionchus entomophagus TaxID=358040 RepID=A0AAV5TD47_9BILA|nr:hypothetical protein PENTCL1PPCAC_15666 [Pristionchus entomophagus]
MNVSLRFGFRYDRFNDTIGWVNSFQLFAFIFNAIVFHPTMLFILYRSRKIMNRGIYWGYVTTEISGFFYDMCFALLRVYAVPPFSAFYCEGLLCRIGLPKQLLVVRFSASY